VTYKPVARKQTFLLMRKQTKFDSASSDKEGPTAALVKLLDGAAPVEEIDCTADYRLRSRLLFVAIGVEFTMSQELLWLRHGNSSGSQRKVNVRR
jgi:hypothetical protein